MSVYEFVMYYNNIYLDACTKASTSLYLRYDCETYCKQVELACKGSNYASKNDSTSSHEDIEYENTKYGTCIEINKIGGSNNYGKASTPHQIINSWLIDQYDKSEYL